MQLFQYGEEPSTPRGESRKTSTQHETAAKRVIEVCGTCNHRIRGQNHNEGAHHLNRVHKK
jgi:hypothetical protein